MSSPQRHPLDNQRLQSAITFGLLLLVSIIFFSLTRAGNVVGGEEFLHPYLVERGMIEMTNRPLALILLWVVEPLVALNPIGHYAVTILVWAICAWVLYHLIRLLSPHRPLFALMCAVIFIVYIPEDFWYFTIFTQTADHLTSLLFMLMALYCYLSFTRLHRWAWLAAAAILALITPLIREATVPLLIGIPTLIFAIERRFDRWRWIGLAVWIGAVLLASVRYALPVLGLTNATYATSVYTGLDVGSIVQNTITQANFAVQPLLHPGRQRIAAVLPQIAVMAVVVLIAVVGWGKRLGDEPRITLREAGAWIAASLAASWLGVVAFLPTLYGPHIERTQLLSKPGEAVLIVSLIWLAADLISTRWEWLRSVVRAGGVVYVLAAGLAMAGYLQLRLDTYGATWSNFEQFMTTLADQVPNVEEQTLFVYIEHPDPYESPFTAGYTFQFAIRYFYEDRATGLMPKEVHYGKIEIGDDGIYFIEDSRIGLQPHLYAWNAIIVIERDANGDVVILQTLPEALYTPARQAQYDPVGRIDEGEMPAHLLETFGR